MKRVLFNLILILLLSCGLTELAEAAVIPLQKTASGSSGENPDKRTYFDPLLVVEMQRDRELWGYDVVLDVDVGPNLYAYVNQNPWTSFDPLGLQTPTRRNKPDQSIDWNQVGTTVKDVAMDSYNEVKRTVNTANEYGAEGRHGMQALGYGLAGAAVIGELADAATGYGKGKVAKEVLGEAVEAVVETGIEKAAKETVKESVEKAARSVAGAGDEAFHYTAARWGDAIKKEGLRPGSYATPTGNLTPLQAKLELALPPTRAAPEIKIRIDLDGIRKAGYEIPNPSRVSSTVRGPDGRVYQMPGGGHEMQFPYEIPGEFLQVLPIK